MPRTDFNQVNDVLEQLQKSGVVNLDKSVREMLGAREAIGKLAPGSEVAAAVIAWDGYGLVIANAAPNLTELARVSDRLRNISGGG